MYTYPCVCGTSTMNFKFDIKGPFTGACCAKKVIPEVTSERSGVDLSFFDDSDVEVSEEVLPELMVISEPKVKKSKKAKK